MSLSTIERKLSGQSVIGFTDAAAASGRAVPPFINANRIVWFQKKFLLQRVKSLLAHLLTEKMACILNQCEGERFFLTNNKIRGL